MAIQDTATLLKQSQAMLDQTKKEGTTSFKGSSYDTFGSADLNPPGKFTPAPVPPATGAAGMQAEIGSNVDYAAQQSEKASAAQANMETARANVSELIASLRGKTGLTAEAYGKKGGVDDIQVELNDINQQIRAEQNALNRRREEIEKNRQGMFGGAMEQEVRNLERESLRKQADLYVIQQGIQGRYDSAKAIADRAVSAYLEEQDILLKQYQFDYEQNKDLFTKAEQREFETIQDERRRAYDREKEDRINVYNLGIALGKNGVSTSIIQGVLKEDDPITALAKYGSYLYEPPKSTESTFGGLTKDQRSALNQIQDNARQDQNIKDFPAIRASYETARSASQDKTGAGDIVLMRMVAKITDPTTGVREEEFRTFEGAQSTLARYGIQLTKQMWKGDRLTDEGRKSLFGQVESIYGQRKAAYDNSYQFYNNQATGWGLDEGSVMPYYAAPVETTKKLTQAEINAYRQDMQPDEVLVRDKETGDIGAVKMVEFTRDKYELIQEAYGI